MNKYDLSILIPGRNEMFLSLTVDGLLRQKRGKTEIIVGLDGKWANPPLADHPDLTIFYAPLDEKGESLGQRAMTNQLARLSKAKYVMKLDAHCIMAEGFDVQMMNDMQDHYTMVPSMYNLYGFDWVCIGHNPRGGKDYYESVEKLPKGCGNKDFQGSTDKYGKCKQCGGNQERLLVWKENRNKRVNYFYRFDKDLHFQYWGAFKDRPEANQDLAPTMSLSGSCFMLTRKKYWELNICDEGHGSWGQQGVEVACKTWLSGGELITNKKTWYAHLFRTQGGDFSFPYPLSGQKQEYAREYSRNFWLKPNLKERFPQAIYKFNWILERFRPVPDWHTDNAVNLKNASETENPDEDGKRAIIYYTDNQLKLKIAKSVQKQLSEISYTYKIPIISASLKPMPHFGKNTYLPLQRGIEAYFKQIITALESTDAEIVYFCEHDVLYHPSHFNFIPPDKNKYYYNQNFWRIGNGDLAVHWDANQVSGLVCFKELALSWFKSKLSQVQSGQFDRSYEPGGRNSDIQIAFKSEFPNIDIRHGKNLTKSKWSLNDFRDKSTAKGWQTSDIHHIPGWEYNDLLCSLVASE